MNRIPTPLVSIGIPTYNRADGYLRKCLASALGQTYENLEVIVSDNCSTDGTSSLLQGMSDPRLRYIRHDRNIGPANNFNYCLEQARGAYFLLLHDDDLIDRDFVQVCIEAAEGNTDLGIIRTGTRVIDQTGKTLHETENNAVGLSTEDFFLAWFRNQTSWYLCSTLYNTKILKETGGFRSSKQLVQDGTAIVQLASKHGRVDIRDVKASFRKHPGELTFSARVMDWCDDYLALLDMMCDSVSSRQDEIRREGMRFFCRLNYNRASAVKNPFSKLKTFLMVYRKFSYAEPVGPYLYTAYLRPATRRIKNIIKTAGCQPPRS